MLTHISTNDLGVTARAHTELVGSPYIELGFGDGRSFVLLTPDEVELTLARLTVPDYHDDQASIFGLKGEGSVHFHGKGARGIVTRELKAALDALRLLQEQQAWAEGMRREGAPA